MNREVEVSVELDGQAHLAGRLWSRLNKGREGASFAYDSSWLGSPQRFPPCCPPLPQSLDLEWEAGFC